MDDELETLLRDHYGRGADEIHADPALVHRFQSAGRDAAGTGPARAAARRWALPVLAGALTAAVVAAVVLLAWPGGSGRSEAPRPMAPPASPGPEPSRTVRPPDLAPAPPPRGPSTPRPTVSTPPSLPVSPPLPSRTSRTPPRPTGLPTAEAPPGPAAATPSAAGGPRASAVPSR